MRRFPHPQVPGPYSEARIWDYYADYRSLIYDLQGLLLPQISTPKERLYRRLDRLPELISRLIKRGFRRRSRERLHKDWKIVHRYGRLCVRAEARAISSPEDEVMEGFDIERFMRSAPGAYFFRVAFPCWLLNGQWPHELFRLASRVERPSLVDLKRLIRIDNRVFHHPGLRDVLHPKDPVRRKSRLSEVKKALGAAPQVPTLANVKRRLVSHISRTSELFLPKRIKPSQINRLFDLVARAPHPLSGESRAGVLADHDLPVGDALRSAIKYYGKQWKLPEKPDKKYFESVQKLNAWLAYDPRHEKAA